MLKICQKINSNDYSYPLYSHLVRQPLQLPELLLVQQAEAGGLQVSIL